MAKRKKKQPKASWWEIGYTIERGIMMSWIFKARSRKEALDKSVKKYGFGRIHFLRKPMPSRLKQGREDYATNHLAFSDFAFHGV